MLGRATLEDKPLPPQSEKGIVDGTLAESRPILDPSPLGAGLDLIAVGLALVEQAENEQLDVASALHLK